MEKKGILFVDDMREVYGKVKKYLGYIMDYASTEEQGLKLIEKNNYGLIITDYDLNDEFHSSGLNIVKAAKEKGLVSLLISRENHREEALEAGANGFMFKKDFLKIFGQDG